MGLPVRGGRGDAPEAGVAVLPESLSLAGPGQGRGPAPPEAAVKAPRRPAASGPRGGERRAGVGERVALSSPGLRSAVHVAPAAAVSAARPGVGAPGGGIGDGGGAVWGAGSVRNGGAARQRVHFPGNQQQAAIFTECCPFN